MNEQDIKQIWNTYNEQLNQSLSINRELLSDVKKMKVISVLSSIKPNRIFAVTIGILWVLMIDFFVVMTFLGGHYFFSASAFIHAIVTKIAIGVSIYHLILISEMKESDSVIEVQKKLSNFKMTTLTGVRLGLLQLPVFTTFYLSASTIASGNIPYIIINLIIISVFTYFGIWCFRNFKVENSHKRWFKFFIEDGEWESLAKAEDLLKQISELKSQKAI